MSAIGRRRRSARQAASDTYLERRSSLLRAAAEVFRAKGLEAVRMDDIVRELDVDRASLYYYFSNKQQLFREVIIEAVDTNVTVAREIADGDGPAREKLQALLVSLLDNYESTYPLLFVYVQEDMRRVALDDSPESKRLVELGNAYDAAIKRVVTQGIEEGEFNPRVHPSVVAYAVIGAANWTHRWYDPTGNFTGAEIGQQFADLFLDGLLVGRARGRRRRLRLLRPLAGRGAPTAGSEPAHASRPAPDVASDGPASASTQ
jgi:AcrR family transcriptional regulator